LSRFVFAEAASPAGRKITGMRARESVLMRTYLPDTNVLIDVGRDPKVRAQVEDATNRGAKFVPAPSMLTELTIGLVKGGAKFFAPNREIFTWLQAHSGAILDLPRPFMGKVLGFASKRSNVETYHYLQRIEMVTKSVTFEEFLARKDEAGNVWTDIEKSDKVHTAQVENEFDALEAFAKLHPGSFDLAERFCRHFGTAESHPNPQEFRRHFSAALEYGETSIAKIRAGANPRKNDRGRYGDFQLFFYLADPDLSILTSEDFSSDIKVSAQRSRIVRLESLS
jgi:hypothetical protein